MLDEPRTSSSQPQPDHGYDPSFRRSTPGERALKGKELRSKKRKTAAKLWIIATVVVAGVGSLLGVLASRSKDTPANRDAEVPAAAKQQTWLLVGTSEQDPTGAAHWLAVASWDEDKDAGVYIYIPKTTYSEIPGHGLETIDRSLSLGKEPLLISTASNMLGVAFDHHLRISDQAMRALVDRVGGITLDVSQKLTQEKAGRVEVIFAEGEQQLNGQRVADYLEFADPSGDEISRSVRHSEVWARLLAKLKEKGPASVVADSMPSFVTDADQRQLSTFLTALAKAPPTSVLFETLPVKPTGVGGGAQLYSLDREKTDEMVEKFLSASRPAGSSKLGRRLEILNGNGRPGIGQEVSDQLIPKGFRVILNQNANSFDYAVTQIVVYSDSKEAVATGREIAGILGVGEVIVSRQKQSIVDVTIVVGKDYLDRKR